MFPECGPKKSRLVEIGCCGLPPSISSQHPAALQSSQESLAVKEDMGMVTKQGLAILEYKILVVVSESPGV